LVTWNNHGVPYSLLTSDDGELVWSLDEIPPATGYLNDPEVIVQVASNVALGDQLVNLLAGSADETEVDYTNNFYTETLQVAVNAVDLAIDKQWIAGNRISGDYVTY